MESSTLSPADIPYLFLSGVGFTIFGVLVTWLALWSRQRNGGIKTLGNKTFRSVGIVNIIIGLFNLATGIYVKFYM